MFGKLSVGTGTETCGIEDGIETEGTEAEIPTDTEAEGLSGMSPDVGMVTGITVEPIVIGMIAGIETLFDWLEMGVGEPLWVCGWLCDGCPD